MDDTELIRSLRTRATQLRNDAAALDAAVMALQRGMTLMHPDDKNRVAITPLAIKALSVIGGVTEAITERGQFSELVYSVVRSKSPSEHFTTPDITAEIETQLGSNAPNQLGTRVATVLNRMVERGEIQRIEDGSGRKPHQYKRS